MQTVANRYADGRSEGDRQAELTVEADQNDPAQRGAEPFIAVIRNGGQGGDHSCDNSLRHARQLIPSFFPKQFDPAIRDLIKPCGKSAELLSRARLTLGGELLTSRQIA